ncbi:hypothetical protein BDZ91DRAFT_739556 [Kalaharituber pfeilii]|nr:hypothetical protein BDZ91DRAFT_739556 [Kalaharituber pfeilii]
MKTMYCTLHRPDITNMTLLMSRTSGFKLFLFPEQDLIISFSRDCSFRLWSRNGLNYTFTQSVNSAGSRHSIMHKRVSIYRKMIKYIYI